MSRESQCRKILKFIRAHGSITTWQAIHRVKCTRLSGRIYDLKKQLKRQNRTIKKVTEKSRDGVRYARYFLASSRA